MFVVVFVFFDIVLIEVNFFFFSFRRRRRSVSFNGGAESFPEGVVLAVLAVGVFMFFVIFFFSFRRIFFFFCLAVIRFFVGVLRGGGPPVVRHSSVGSLGSTGADMMKEWRGAGSRIRGSRQKYAT